MIHLVPIFASVETAFAFETLASVDDLAGFLHEIRRSVVAAAVMIMVFFIIVVLLFID